MPGDAEDSMSADEDDGLTISGGRLVLTKTTTKGSVAAIDAPRAQYTVLIIELLAIIAVDGINIAALILQA